MTLWKASPKSRMSHYSVGVDAWQEGQIDFIFIVQVNFAHQSPLLQLLQASELLLIVRVGTADREDWTPHAVSLSVQGATHIAFAHCQPRLLFE